ncbi:MAG: DUF3237 domain-containing protein [Alcaligenaceae bacterium]|nr:MAG: DUF3237 domain-containing protein [Alcaligenaceae bacterium]
MLQADKDSVTAFSRPIETEFLFQYDAQLREAPGYDFGQTPSGHLRIGALSGGSIDGPRIKASILEASDYPIIRSDNVAVPDCKAVLRTDDDELVFMSYTGCIGPWTEFLAARQGKPYDADAIDWKILLSFQTSSSKYDWLNRTMAVGRGEFAEGGFRYQVYALI